MYPEVSTFYVLPTYVLLLALYYHLDYWWGSFKTNYVHIFPGLLDKLEDKDNNMPHDIKMYKEMSLNNFSLL